MNEDLVTWLRACLREDEQAAQSVPAPKWFRYLEGGEDGWAIENEPPGCDFVVGDDAAAKHIALNDPDRVLRKVAAIRNVIELAIEASKIDRDLTREFSADPGPDTVWVGDKILLALASEFFDRPGFREEWAL